LLQVHQLSRRFGAHPVLDSVSFSLHRGDVAALIGPNGAGKSTLLRCIAGVDRPDGGAVSLGPGVTAGYLEQDPLAGHASVHAVLNAASGGLLDAEAAVVAAAAAFGKGELDDATYDAAIGAFEARGGYGRLARLAEVLDGLGARFEDDRDPGTLSGGQRTRLALACLLITGADLLLLDEPTNHLDLDGVRWLEGFVRQHKGAVLIASHDREFLDRVATRTLFIDPRTRSLREYPGGYTEFVAARAAEREQQGRAWREQERYIDQVKRDISRLKSEARSIELSTTPRQPGLRVYARRKARVALSREKKLERYQSSGERVEKPQDGWQLAASFDGAGPLGREALRLEGVTFAYVPGPPLLRDVTLAVRHHERVAIIGPNGAGKSTLLALLAGHLEPGAGAAWRSPSVRAGFIGQSPPPFGGGVTVLEVLQRARPMHEGDARTFLHRFLFAGDSAFRLAAHCSPGELARLQLACLVAEGCNLLFLDEPLNHLDVESREQFEAALAAFDGTVVAVSHDRRFLDRFAMRVVEVRDGSVADFPGTFAAYEASRQKTIGSRLVNS
jgi:ATP-binding cassette subfamily F protein 3